VWFCCDFPEYFLVPGPIWYVTMGYKLRWHLDADGMRIAALETRIGTRDFEPGPKWGLKLTLANPLYDHELEPTNNQLFLMRRVHESLLKLLRDC
jgi:hypothetical protein